MNAGDRKHPNHNQRALGRAPARLCTLVARRKGREVVQAASAAETILTFRAYSRAASETDQTGEDGVLVAVLGIVGEAGDLATLFKKRLRDGENFTFYPEQCAEELGDILWYMSTLCTRLGLSLEEVATQNIAKIQLRWSKQMPAGPRPLPDESFPPGEQIPRSFEIEFQEEIIDGRTVVTAYREGKKLGDKLTDNAHFEDGYRYHDAFHLAYAAILGWSPIVRRLMGCKRRSNSQIDEVEDGGRAAVIEEAVAAVVFQYAEKHNMLEGIGHVDSELLSMLSRLTAGLEVREVSPGEWERAILEGFRVFRLLTRNRSGIVSVDLKQRAISYRNSRPKAAKASGNH